MRWLQVTREVVLRDWLLWATIFFCFDFFQKSLTTQKALKLIYQLCLRRQQTDLTGLLSSTHENLFHNYFYVKLENFRKISGQLH